MKTKIRNRWSPRLNRTASIYALVALFLALAAFWAAGQNWVAYSLQDSPSCSVLGSPATINTGGSVASVPDACETGWTLAGAAENADPAAQESKDSYWIPRVGAFPALTVNIAILGVVVAFGLLQRSALILGAAQYFTYATFNSYTQTSAALAGGLLPEQFATQTGWVIATGIAVVSAVVAIGSLILVATTNHRIRRDIISEAAGRESLGLISDLRVFARSAPLLVDERLQSQKS